MRHRQSEKRTIFKVHFNTSLIHQFYFMSLDNKTVFLAGSTGLVGSSIIKNILTEFPHTKIRAAYYHTEPFIKHESIEYVCGDLRSKADCQRLIEGCDCAVLAAANTAGSSALNFQPWHQVNDNLIMNAQMLEVLHAGNIKRVVFISSATVYQQFEGSIKEPELNLNQDPPPSYLGIGWVMRYLEKLCQFWYTQVGMEFAIVRASNIFGPFARFDPATSNFIPAIIRKAVDKMDPFEVWGSADVTRDVIFADDFGRAVVMLLDNDNIKFDTFNIGSGVKTTVGEVVEWSLKYAGHAPSKITYNADKPTTIKFRALDCSKANEKLGWQPQYTIEEGIKHTAEWWIENKDCWQK